MARDLVVKEETKKEPPKCAAPGCGAYLDPQLVRHYVKGKPWCPSCFWKDDPCCK